LTLPAVLSGEIAPLEIRGANLPRRTVLFRTFMGEQVEPRWGFIQKHALEVKDIDYHGA
jgi:hypothetical protein